MSIPQTPSKTKLPNTMTKSEFTVLCHPLPYEKAINRINLIIYDNRKNFKENEQKNRAQIVATKTIERRELVEYFETYGWPKNVEA